MPTLTTVTITKTIEVLVPHRHPADITRRMVLDLCGDVMSLSDVTITAERTVTVSWAAEWGPKYRVNDEGDRLTDNAVDWIEGVEE